MTNLAPPDVLDQAVLTLLISRHPSPVHLSELQRAFSGDDWATSVAELERDGLAHPDGMFVHASRAAVRSAELL